jgi:uncharacterized protein YjeT (DUF2065 family)
MSLFISALGLMMIFEGIPYFCFPTQLKEIAKKIPSLSNSVLRVIGFFLMSCGLIVAYIGRSWAS